MKIDEFYIGQSASLKKVFDSDEVMTFAQLSLDKNPIHIDEEYAARSLFGKRIVHGFLVGSLISAVFGTKLPGEGAIYLHQEMDFRKPVYHGDEITASVTVTDIRKDKSILYFDTKCENDRGEVVIEGKAVLKV
jgi:acyl dehydratase